MAILSESDFLYNIYEIQIRAIKNDEFDQLHLIYIFRVPKNEFETIGYEKITIGFDFPNNYSVLKENLNVQKRSLLTSIMNQISDESVTQTEILITYLKNAHSFKIDNTLEHQRKRRKLSKNEKKLLVQTHDKNREIRDEIKDLIKKILKID